MICYCSLAGTPVCDNCLNNTQKMLGDAQMIKMNEVQRVLKETENDWFNYKSDNETLRQETIRHIDLQIERLVRRKKRLEAGASDYVMYDE